MCAQDYDKRTSLHLVSFQKEQHSIVNLSPQAAAEGHTDCVKLLVETCGVSPTMRDRWGFTPLVEAHRLPFYSPCPQIGYPYLFIYLQIPTQICCTLPNSCHEGAIPKGTRGNW